MAWVPGGTFRMGSDQHYQEERPAHDVAVDGLWVDIGQVTVTAFRRFVKATGYVTVAERPLDPADYPDADPDLLVPGLARLPEDHRPGRPRRLSELVALGARRAVAAPGRARAATSPAATGIR